MLKDWERHGEKKVALQIHSQKEMDEIELKAFGLSVPTQVIRDAGRTEVEPGTKTVIAVAGPAYMVDQVTGHLKLLR
jgi:PTH2 family peptidyl-tRNA hydrolase